MNKDALRSTNDAKARMQPLAAEVKIRYVGCYSGERFFSEDKEYHGSSSGANFNLIKYTAVTNKRRYFGVARAVTDGHGFVFDKLLAKPNMDSSEAGCQRGCADDASKPCGCVDGLCQAAIPRGEEHNRRWAVYEVVNQDAKASSSATKKANKKAKKNKMRN